MIRCSLGKVSPAKSLGVTEVRDETQSCSITLSEESKSFQRSIHAKKKGTGDHEEVKRPHVLK